MLVVQHPTDDFHVVWNYSFHPRPFPNESDDEVQMMTSYLEKKKQISIQICSIDSSIEIDRKQQVTDCIELTIERFLFL